MTTFPDELAEIAIQYDDPMQPVSVAEASEMLIKAAQHFEYDIDDVERIIDRLCEIPMVNPVSADDCAQGRADIANSELDRLMELKNKVLKEIN